MALILILLFLVLPIAEIYVIIQVGGAIGIVPTLFLLVLDGIAGAALARWQGRAAWERFNLALSAGRVPAKETFDGAMIIVGGAFLLAPGFITDVIGFLLLIPPTRAVLRERGRPPRPPPGVVQGHGRRHPAPVPARRRARRPAPALAAAGLRLRGHRPRGDRRSRAGGR